MTRVVCVKHIQLLAHLFLFNFTGVLNSLTSGITKWPGARQNILSATIFKGIFRFLLHLNLIYVNHKYFENIKFCYHIALIRYPEALVWFTLLY